MPTLREFQSQRPNRILYETITFYNETFGYVRLVNNQIFPKTLGGQVFTPCRMEIKKSQQSSTPVSDSTIKFSRLAQDFKQKLKLWKAHSRITPIPATYQQFDAADMSTATRPLRVLILRSALRLQSRISSSTCLMGSTSSHLPGTSSPPHRSSMQGSGLSRPSNLMERVVPH